MSFRITLPLMAVAILATAFAAACTGAPAATVSVSAAIPPTATPLPTRPSMDPELEALLPDRVGELDISKSSLAGLEFASTADPSFRQFLQDIGVSGAAISVASGVGESTATPPSTIFLLALRVQGANEEQLVSTFRRALEQNEQRPYTITSQTVAGKDVLLAVAGPEDPPAYFYALGDVMLFVAASDDALAQEALTLLP